MRSQAFVLLSGGIDSTTCLFIATQQFGYKNVRAVSIDYGQRHIKETECARRTCDENKIPHLILPIKHIVPNTMLTDPSIKVPHTSYDQIKGVSPTYVPFRNGLMLSALASFVHGTLKNEGLDQPGVEHALFYGAHAEDAANWAYPDCTPEFNGAMATAIFIGTYQRVRLHIPLQWMDKKSIIEKGDLLGVNWLYTWSCYKGEELHCGQCPTCLARRKGFSDAGVTDPTQYAV